MTRPYLSHPSNASVSGWDSGLHERVNGCTLGDGGGGQMCSGSRVGDEWTDTDPDGDSSQPMDRPTVAGGSSRPTATATGGAVRYVRRWQTVSPRPRTHQPRCCHHLHCVGRDDGSGRWCRRSSSTKEAAAAGSSAFGRVNRVKTEPDPPLRSVHPTHISPVHRHTEMGSP